MKRLLVVAVLLALLVPAAQFATAQTAFVNQTVSFTVSTVEKMSISGNPGALTISTGTAGTDALTAVGDSSTNYSVTHNHSAGPMKITAQIGSAMPAGLTLEIKLASTKGTSGGYIDISNGASFDVVTAIAKGADANQKVYYNFGALASSGDQTGSRTVTLTLTP